MSVKQLKNLVKKTTIGVGVGGVVLGLGAGTFFGVEFLLKDSTGLTSLIGHTTLNPEVILIASIAVAALISAIATAVAISVAIKKGKNKKDLSKTEVKLAEEKSAQILPTINLDIKDDEVSIYDSISECESLGDMGDMGFGIVITPGGDVSRLEGEDLQEYRDDSKEDSEAEKRLHRISVSSSRHSNRSISPSP